jgi:hypothetical protein
MMINGKRNNLLSLYIPTWIAFGITTSQMLIVWLLSNSEIVKVEFIILASILVVMSIVGFIISDYLKGLV